MALRDQPYIPLYVQDIMTDEKLNNCSASTHGVYIKGIMCLMHKSEHYGKILLNQKFKQGDKQSRNFALMLVKHLPYSIEEIEAAIDELLTEKVCFLEDDFLCQKRMIRDGEISKIRSSVGKKGGNNSLGKNKKNLLNQNQKQITENENENKDEIKILNKKDEIKNLSKEYFNEVMESFSDWRTYLGKQHEIYLKENEYTYQIVIDTLKKIPPSKFKDSVSYSMNSTYKKIYERPNDRPKTETKPKSKGINDVWQDKLAKLNQGA